MFEPVEIGSAADDASGDSLRDAFAKLNRNFAVLAEHLAQMSADLADARAAAAPDWPGSFVARHVTQGAPTDAPPLLGAVWVDAEAGEVYVSTGTKGASDWVRIAKAEG